MSAFSVERGSSSEALWRRRRAFVARFDPLAVLFLLAVCAGVAGVFAVLVTRESPTLRLLVALLLLLLLFPLAIWEPPAATILLIGFLPFLALTRRLLIPFAGWQSIDPLLLVAPVVAVTLLHQARARGVDKARDPVSRLLTPIVVLTFVQSLNPLGGSIKAGIVGLIFVAAPFLWFYIGRDLIDTQAVKTIVAVIVGTAVVAAVYGLFQTEVAFPAWDATWVQLAGYTSLSVGGAIRAFGTFSSSAEYGAWIDSGLMIALAYVMHRRLSLLLVVPLFGVALVLESGRGNIFLTFGAFIVLLGIRTGRKGTAWVVSTLAVVALGVAFHFASPGLQANASTTSNPLLAHQLGGIAHPLDPNASTLALHWRLLLKGFEDGFRHPVGYGTGVTSLAAGKFGGVDRSSEVDVSNEFVSLGLIGGVLYLLLVIVALRETVRLYFARRDALTAAVLGVLLISLGQWLNGGFYALSPVVWIFIGWASRERTRVLETI